MIHGIQELVVLTQVEVVVGVVRVSLVGPQDPGGVAAGHLQEVLVEQPQRHGTGLVPQVEGVAGALGAEDVPHQGAVVQVEAALLLLGPVEQQPVLQAGLGAAAGVGEPRLPGQLTGVRWMKL